MAMMISGNGIEVLRTALDVKFVRQPCKDNALQKQDKKVQ